MAGSNAGLGPDSCGDNGDRGPLHGHAHKRHLPTLADDAARRCPGWCCYGDLCSDDRHHSERHQEGPCLFNRLTTRFHVHGLRRRSVYVIGIFHVMTHAFFKALMFLGAGSVIHGMHHEQDMRRMGGLKKYMPYTFWTFMAGWLAICGIIPFSGFWSKDEILWKAASTTYIPLGWLIWLVGTIAATCTAFYMTRLVLMTFFGKERFLEDYKPVVRPMKLMPPLTTKA